MAKKNSKTNKFNFLNQVHQGLLQSATVARDGTVRIKRGDLKKVLEEVFGEGARLAAGGQRIRFPIIGALARKEVKARKAGKGTNPFTGEPMDIKARPASKKPRWSFPKSLKETFANKKHW